MPAPFVYPHDPKRPGCECRDCTTRQRASLAAAIIVAVAALLILAVVAKAAEPRPVPAPPALIAAREACPDTASLAGCRGELRKALAAVAWQKHERQHQSKYGVQHALRLASALYGVPLAQMRRVATCESGLAPRAKNTSSTAAGLFQFLNTTWQRAGIRGFTAYDPYASAIAAARLVTRDGSWREWQCTP